MRAARHRLSVRRACVLLAGVIGAGLEVGCATAPSAAAPPAAARLTIANVTDYAWRVVLSPKRADFPSRQASLAPRETLVLELPAGAYTIEQTIAGTESPAAARRFGAEFDAGGSYEWPLATVRSVAEAP